MNELFNKVAFSIAETPFTWGDGASAAVKRGDWERLEREVAETLACRAHGAATNTSLPAGEPEASALEFRYSRDLLTARDAEAWLAHWSISAREWSEYFRRVLYRQLFASEAAELAAAQTVDPAELQRATIVHAVCSGRLEQFANALALRAAAAASLDEPLDIETLDASFDRYQASALTERAIAEVITANRLDWVRVHCRSVSFDSLPAAREGAMCVRDDGLDLATVAADAHATLIDDERYLEELPAAARDQLLGARAGDIVGPVAADGHWTLYEVIAKHLPSVDNTLIRRRAERDVIDRAAALDVQRRVRWADAESAAQ